MEEKYETNWLKESENWIYQRIYLKLTTMSLVCKQVVLENDHIRICSDIAMTEEGKDKISRPN